MSKKKKKNRNKEASSVEGVLNLLKEEVKRPPIYESLFESTILSYSGPTEELRLLEYYFGFFELAEGSRQEDLATRHAQGLEKLSGPSPKSGRREEEFKESLNSKTDLELRKYQSLYEEENDHDAE